MGYRSFTLGDDQIWKDLVESNDDDDDDDDDKDRSMDSRHHPFMKFFYGVLPYFLTIVFGIICYAMLKLMKGGIKITNNDKMSKEIQETKDENSIKDIIYIKKKDDKNNSDISVNEESKVSNEE